LRHPAGRRLGGTGRRTLERHEGGDEPQRPRADGRLGARAGRRGRLTPAPPIPECALVPPPPVTGEGWGGGKRVALAPSAPAARPPIPPFPRKAGTGRARG